MNVKLTHEKFLEKLLQKNKYYANGDIEIVGQYMGFREPIECHCNIHDINWESFPTDLCNDSGCFYCNGKKNSRKKWKREIIVGLNDMWTTRPDVASMLQDPEDGYKYSFGSNEKTWFVCPDCKTPAFKTINNVSSYGLCCQHCSDHISYPNKFSRALLDQLPIDGYDCEYQPKWAEPYYYDNHFWYDGTEYILEMDGHFHFREGTFSRNTLEQTQERDRIKNELALQHNIHIIRIDCIKSDMNYIKSNMLNSELNVVFDLSDIDWELCEQKAQKNVLKEACKLYMTRMYNCINIGEILHINQSTVRRYLIKGAKYGWCDYSPIKEKAVVVIDDSGQIIHSFHSMSECCREMRHIYKLPFFFAYIRKALESHEPYHGFNFRFANEFNNNN